MMKTVCISDSIVSPLGLTVAENFSAVMSGKSGVTRHEGTFGVPEPFMASLLDREAIGAEACRRGIRDLNLFETVQTLSIEDAARGVDLTSPRTGIIISSIKGNVEAIGTDPTEVPISASAQRIAAHFGNPNTPLVVSNACISGLTALIHARRLLLSGRYDTVVVAGAEVQSKFIVSGFQSLKALSPNPCKPFDAARDGLNLGEAAATMVLTLADDGPWELVEGATRNDANHISGPSRVGEGSYNALRYALRGCDPSEVAFINVHGTSTLYNDEMESIAIDRAGMTGTPVNALKAYYGHTMGAAGILESIISMRAVEAGVILPTLGFETLGVSRPVNVSNAMRTTDKTSFVKLLSGFGGCNAAMLFRKGGQR